MPCSMICNDNAKPGQNLNRKLQTLKLNIQTGLHIILATIPLLILGLWDECWPLIFNEDRKQYIQMFNC